MFQFGDRHDRRHPPLKNFSSQKCLWRQSYCSKLVLNCSESSQNVQFRRIVIRTDLFSDSPAAMTKFTFIRSLSSSSPSPRLTSLVLSGVRPLLTLGRQCFCHDRPWICACRRNLVGSWGTGNAWPNERLRRLTSHHGRSRPTWPPICPTLCGSRDQLYMGKKGI